MGMPTILVANGTGTSSIWFPDWMQNPFNIGIQAVVTPSGTFNVEHTLDNIDLAANTTTNTLNLSLSNTTTAGAATWIANPGISAATANINGNYAFPVRAIRVNVLSAVSTTIVTVTFVQATFGR